MRGHTDDRAQQHVMNVAVEHFPSLPVEAIEWEVLLWVTIHSEEVIPYRLFRQSRKLGTESYVPLEVLFWSH
jgi:hypothetical protein